MVPPRAYVAPMQPPPVHPPTFGTPRRWGVFAVGITCLIAGISLMITADLGVGSWQVLETGLVAATGWAFGLVALLESLAALALAWAWLGQRPWIATAIMATLGIPIGALLAVMSTPAGLLGQVAMLAAGLALLPVGVAFYLAADLGPSAQDALFVGYSTKYGVRPGVVRFVLDASLVGGGFALGGQVGVGTIAVTVTLPLLIEPALRVGHALARTPLPATLRRPDLRTPGA